MDTSVFRADFDVDGKRHRSLALYGVDDAFRSTDPFVEAHSRIVECVAHFCQAAGASITVWPSAGRRVLAGVGPDAERATDAMWQLVFAGASAPHRVVTGSWGGTWRLLAAPLDGRERVPLGVLCVWAALDGSWPSQAPLLVEQLARAAVAVLEDQGRVWSVRTAAASSRLWLVDGRERRRADGFGAGQLPGPSTRG